MHICTYTHTHTHTHTPAAAGGPRQEWVLVACPAPSTLRLAPGRAAPIFWGGDLIACQAPSMLRLAQGSKSCS
jgi:hypothetical protein